MDAATFLRHVAGRLQCDTRRADAVMLAVFRALRDRLTSKQAADVEAQLPAGLKRLWQERDRRNRPVDKMHREEFLSRVQLMAALPDAAEAERAVLAVFSALQLALGSPTGKEGEAWDVFSQLPRDLKTLWLAAGERKVS
ncbi:MAG: DUF2267 domain-containing protein [Candidatus Binatia bacterium]